MPLDYSRANEPYKDASGIISDFTEILDMHLYYMYKYRPWICPDDNLRGMMGITVSAEEFESRLLEASDFSACSALDKEERASVRKLRGYFIGRLRATVKRLPDIPLVNAGIAFRLDYFEFFVFLMLVCCELNSKYEKLFVYLQDDISKKTPVVETAVRLFAEPDTPVADYFRYFSSKSPLGGFICEMEGGTLLSSRLRLSKQARCYIFGTDDGDFELFRSDSELHPLYIDLDTAEEIRRSIINDENTRLFYLTGKNGSGKRFQAKHAAKRFGKSLVFVRAETLLDTGDIKHTLNSAVCAAVLNNGAVCVTDFEILLDDDKAPGEFARAVNECQRYIGAVLFITSKKKWYEADLSERIIRIDIEIPDTDEDSRLSLWERFTTDAELSDEIDLHEIAAKFRFTAGQIHNAVRRAVMTREAPVTAKTLHDSCYDQVVVGLDSLASPIRPSYTFEDLVIPESEMKLLKEACSHVKYKHAVYSGWGFGKKAAYGRGLSVLFSGPPGTGKTMAAQAVTSCLNMRLYKIQISQVVSKYIGETEKNLRRVFEEAKSANCILFFDEMDALFGKRSEVKDSHDRNANIETAFLLQQMEEYDGVVLMATNLLQNIDEAFMRRINFVINFPFPDEKTRAGLWRKMLDAKAPLAEDIDYDFLGSNFRFAGGNIKNCAVHAAFLAVSENSPIMMRHLIISAVTEMRKNNIVVLKDQLKEYADLVFGEDGNIVV